MRGNCIKCGKVDYLNKEGVCYRCYEHPKVEKIKMPHRLMSETPATLLYVVALILNSCYSIILLADCVSMNAFYLYACWVVVLDILRIVYLGVGMEKRGYWRYPIWQEPLCNIVAKVIFSLTELEDYYLWVWSVFWIVGAVIQVKLGNRRHEKRCFYVICKDVKKYEKGLKDIDAEPCFEEFDPLADCKNWKDKLPLVEQAMEDLSIDERLRPELMKLFEDTSDVLSMNNETKYLYCSIVQRLAESENLWNSNNFGITNISQRIFDYADDYPEYKRRGWRHPFLMEKEYKFSSKLRTEICEPYRKLKMEEQVIKNDMKEFVQDAISIYLGEDGERRVADRLKDYTDQIILLPNLRLEVDGQSVESDFVLLSPYGIYVLEVKNLGSGGGYGIRIEKDGRWCKTYNGNVQLMNNVVAQNERHILFLEKYINQRLRRPLDDYIRVRGIVVLANDVVDILNDSDDIVVRYTNIMSTIRNQPIVMKEKDMKEIAQILNGAALPPKPYDVMNGFQRIYIKGTAWKHAYQAWIPVLNRLMEIAVQYGIIWDWEKQ